MDIEDTLVASCTPFLLPRCQIQKGAYHVFRTPSVAIQMQMPRSSIACPLRAFRVPFGATACDETQKWHKLQSLVLP